jgi:DNA-binding XRE family transcriptional regulator
VRHPDGKKIAFQAAMGAALRTHRAASGMTLAAIATAIGTSASTLQKFETGELATPSWIVAALADLFGVTTDALMRPGRRAA